MLLLSLCRLMCRYSIGTIKEEKETSSSKSSASKSPAKSEHTKRDMSPMAIRKVGVACFHDIVRIFLGITVQREIFEGCRFHE